jgi:polar amino acid transport system substrate-binding protein
MTTSIKANEVIKVVTEDWPPYNYALPNGQVGGLTTKIVRQVLDKSGLKYDIKIYPWARSYDMAVNQSHVLIYSIFRLKNREHQFKWICPLTKPIELYFFKLTDNSKVEITNLNDAKKYTVGVTRGDYPHHYLMNQGFTVGTHLQLSPSDSLNVKKLVNGRIDLVVEAELTMRTILSELGKPFSDVYPITKIIQGKSTQNCMAFGIKTPDNIVQRVQSALNSIQQK